MVTIAGGSHVNSAGPENSVSNADQRPEDSAPALMTTPGVICHIWQESDQQYWISTRAQGYR